MKKSLLLLMLLAAGASASAQSITNNNRYPLIPWPSSLEAASGTAHLDAHSRIIVPAGAFTGEARALQQLLRKYLGPAAASISSATGSTTATDIVLRDDATLTAPESYQVTVSGKHITLSAHHAAGMFYAVQTLRQLMPASVENGHGKDIPLPNVNIHDQPVYAWRGMMLDVSRHFFSMRYLQRFVDMMALYKFNKLHLHLTDDQGWRIEIKQYPKLTTGSGWRTFNDQDSACIKLAAQTGNPDMEIDPAHLRHVNGHTQYGGYYTQAEMKAFIQYAAARHIEVIPEIDMPGHMMAAILQYPELTCSGQARDWRQGFSTPICPCKDTVLAFARNVFAEIAALFPSKYIHIGGDEVERSEWERSELCQQFMKAHGLTNTAQLQSWFIDQMEAFFHEKGKTLLGWDEIVEGGIDSTATVMFWRIWARMAPLKAASNGNKLVMTADGPLYFDALPDKYSLSAVYHYDPNDTIYRMNATQQQQIMGLQANLWTERVPTENRADYLLMPRMTALAESAWSRKDLYASYLQRLEAHYPRLENMGVHYRLPDLPEASERRVFVDTATFFFASPAPQLTLRYTEQGFPTASSPALTKPLLINSNRTVRVAAFTAKGRRGDIKTITFEQQAYAAPVATFAKLQPGLQVQRIPGAFNTTKLVKGNADTTMVLTNVALPAGMPESYALLFRGYLKVPATGIYSFFLLSDDGSVLKIADRVVVDNDGGHSAEEKSGQIALGQGLHPFVLDYMNIGGGADLQLLYSQDGGKPQPVPASWFFRSGTPN